jgi:transcription initiation factor TFIIB
MKYEAENSPLTQQTTRFNELQKNRTVCPDCSSQSIVRDETRGEIICADCGIVLSSNLIDLGPEWRSFTKEQQDLRRRVGSPMNFMRSDKGLTTTLGWGFRDARGRSVPANRRAEIQRMRKWQRRSRQDSSKERNLAIAMNEVDRLAGQLRLPYSVKDQVALLYRRVLDRNLIRGRTIEGIIGAVLYIICRKLRIPITMKEIARYSRIDAKTMGRCYRFIMRKFEIDIPVISPKDFVPRFVEDLNLPARVERCAIRILESAHKKLIISGKAPSGLAAAALYIAAMIEGKHTTQREIGEVAKVTEVTIRNRYKELVEELNLQMLL